MKTVKSDDPRKKAIVQAFKNRSGATRVTCVQEYEGMFYAHCLKSTWEGKGGAYRMPNFESLGTFCLDASDVEGAA